jgi:hypothetical protein
MGPATFIAQNLLHIQEVAKGRIALQSAIRREPAKAPPGLADQLRDAAQQHHALEVALGMQLSLIPAANDGGATDPRVA